MTRDTAKTTSRRDFLKLTGASAAFGPFFLFSSRALASQKTLKIAKWAHFLPEFDSWFEGMAKEWGQKHDIAVTVEHIPVENVHTRAWAEVKAAKGHDVFMFPWPPAEYQQHVIDHAEIIQQVSSAHGNIDWVAHRSSANLSTKKYFAFADSWIPAPFLYFQDYWSEANSPAGPLHYDGLRSGAKRLRQKLGVSCGLAFTPTLEGNITLQTLLYAFTSGVLNEAGNVIIKNARTFVALQYVKDLFQGAGTAEQLTWGPSANVKAMLARKTSCTFNGIGLLRAAEKQDPLVAKNIMISPPLKGTNSIVAVPHVTNCSVIWNFAENQDAAKQFLADLIDNSQNIYEQSQGCNFPFYQKTLPDLIVRLSNDPHADPHWKYEMLKDALHWTHYLGVPGYPTPAFMEVFNTFVVPRMFLSVVKGERSPEEAMNAAAAEIQRVADKWASMKL